MIKVLRTVFVGLLSALLSGSAAVQEPPTVLSESVRHFKVDVKILSESLNKLKAATERINDADTRSITAVKNALANSRLAYKRIEYFMEYFFTSSSRIYNRAPKHEVEEPFMEYQAPAGFQYIETMLFDSLPGKRRQDISDQIKLLSLSSDNLNALLYQFPGTDAQVFESMRLQLIRIVSLGITGFDAPRLKTGIQEAKVSLEVVREILSNSLKNEEIQADSVHLYLDSNIQYLTKNNDFDSFDRIQFLIRHALPLQMHLGKLIRDMKMEINTHNALNYNAKHLFSRDAFNQPFFSSTKKNPSLAEIALGKKLFFDKTLSGNSSKSCATCHNPVLHFSDGLPKSIGFQPNTFVERNAPSLLYAGFQHSQFWDGRSKTLEMQIETVVKDPAEMHGNVKSIIQKLSADKVYLRAFQKVFHQKPGEKIRERNVYQAIASYVGTLNPFNSRFDHYINGDASALTEPEIRGFNVFMGKGQCGTCHFAPLFNGLVPPAFKQTEFEVLGTPENDLLDSPTVDGDDGRFSFFPIEFYKNAFKTPTVRNTSVTSPYMHNGGFKSLESVIDFYDRGGGAGLGFDFPNQTLSAARLNLTDKEKQDIIAFLHTLTDDL